MTGPVGRGREAAAERLGVAPDASPAEVLAAYRRSVRRLHPDTGGVDDDDTRALLAQLRADRTTLLGPDLPEAAEPPVDGWAAGLDVDLDDDLDGADFDLHHPALSRRIGLVMAVTVVVFGLFLVALALVVLTQGG